MHPLTIMLTELRQGVVRPTRGHARNLTPRPPTPPRRPRSDAYDPPVKTRSKKCSLEVKTKATKKKLDALQKRADEFRKQLLGEVVIPEFTEKFDGF